MQKEPSAAPVPDITIAFPGALAAGEPIWAKTCYTLIWQHGQETGDTFLTRNQLIATTLYLPQPLSHRDADSRTRPLGLLFLSTLQPPYSLLGLSQTVEGMYPSTPLTQMIILNDCGVKIHSRQCNQCNHSANKEIYYFRAVLSKWEFCYWGLKYYSLESYFILLMIFSYSRRYCTYQITLRSKDPKPQDEVHCKLNKFFLFTKCNFGQMHTCDLIKTRMMYVI